MRIVIDLQCAQSCSRNRGIGRYSLGFAKALARNRGEHEIFLVLNGRFEDTILPIRAEFRDLVPAGHIHVWHAHGPLNPLDPDDTWRINVAEMTREAAIASLAPSVVVVASLFEGLKDGAVTSIDALGKNVPTAVILYDLIPALYREVYLYDSGIAAWYDNKIEHLRRADLLLSISESSRQEALDHFGLPSTDVVNIGTDADPQFQVRTIDCAREQSLRQQYGLDRPFVMYTGGIDHRKNIEGLIRAWSLLPQGLQNEQQLTIVCSIQDSDQQRLQQLARQHGILDNSIAFTGFVPEHDLVDLYNLCKLFVIPSIHEGFGLPALEAMRCGKAVIAANSSSFPEVIGRQDALFDPTDDQEIASKLELVLSDDDFRHQLEQHASVQASRFSWDKTARSAILALESLHTRHDLPNAIQTDQRPRLAFVSPLPPARTGIADYCAELLPELARYYEIDIIVNQDITDQPWGTPSLPIRSVEWFHAHASEFDRILYHFGNSEFHEHMFALLEEHSGIVVLHDFYLSGIISRMEAHGINKGFWTQSLYHSHGYHAIHERFHEVDTNDVVWKYPCNTSVLRNADGVIVHSQNPVQLAHYWYDRHPEEFWARISLGRAPSVVDAKTRHNARSAFGMEQDDFLVASFGLIRPSKLSHRILEAWLSSSLAQDRRCKLVFVGDCTDQQYQNSLRETIQSSSCALQITITGWVSDAIFQQYLSAADVAVQLRTYNRGESSAAVLDCMNNGIPTIVNAHGSMAELPDDGVWKLDDNFSNQELITSLENLHTDPELRQALGSRGRETVLQSYSICRGAEEYYTAVERFYRKARTGISGLVRAVGTQQPADVTPGQSAAIANAIASSIPPAFCQPQLLVDISAIVNLDLKTGIQRVVRNILFEWLRNPPPGYRIEPVYADEMTTGYRYARDFTLRFLNCDAEFFDDEPVEYFSGDVFVGLDLALSITPQQSETLAAMRRSGVLVKFVVYDLLPIQFSRHFPDGVAEIFTRWLGFITESDGAICISRTVASQLRAWVNSQTEPKDDIAPIDWFHLGADLTRSPTVSTNGIPTDIDNILATLRSRPTFLVVGTIEPRKGHTQILEAFINIWDSGAEANLVIVGKQGWMTKRLCKKLRSHPERGNYLFWFEQASDEYLEVLYAESTCLIAASEGEGFGLPLIEAAQRNLPILARNIPVFHEIAGEHAWYFDGNKPGDLAREILHWIDLYHRDTHPKPDSIRWLSWSQSAAQLLSRCLGQEKSDHDNHGENERIVFIHIPKTAGTSSRNFFNRAYGEEKVGWVNVNLDINDIHLINRLTKYKVIGGHFPHSATTHIPGQVIRIAVIREPVSRAISLYRYIQNNKSHVLHSTAMNLNMQEMIETTPDFRYEVSNLQSHWLSVSAPKLRTSHTGYEYALENIYNNRFIVGAFDSMDSLITQTKILLNLPADLELGRHNVRPNPDQLDPLWEDNALTSLLQDLNKEDSKLLIHVKNQPNQVLVTA